MNAVTHGLLMSSPNITFDWVKVLMCREAFIPSLGLADEPDRLDSAEEFSFLPAAQHAVVDRVRGVRHQIWAVAEKCDELVKRGSYRGLRPELYPPEDRECVEFGAKFMR